MKEEYKIKLWRYSISIDMRMPKNIDLPSIIFSILIYFMFTSFCNAFIKPIFGLAGYLTVAIIGYIIMYYLLPTTKKALDKIFQFFETKKHYIKYLSSLVFGSLIMLEANSISMQFLHLPPVGLDTMSIEFVISTIAIYDLFNSKAIEVEE